MIKNQVSIESFKCFLEKRLKDNLPGMMAQEKMIPVFPDNTPEYFNYNQVLREAAVLICLFEDKERIKTILIERVPDSGPHYGKIAFPGGGKEDIDNDLIETALREAAEEVGIVVSKSAHLGNLTPVQIPISRYNVLPVICFTNEIGSLTICEDEVKNVFVVDLLDLLESEQVRDVNARNIIIPAPSFAFGNQIVWGATAMVLRELKEILP